MVVIFITMKKLNNKDNYMAQWRKNTRYGKYTILKGISENPGKPIYSIMNGNVNFRVYTNIRELEESEYIQVNVVKEKEKLLFITEKGQQTLDTMVE